MRRILTVATVLFVLAALSPGLLAARFEPFENRITRAKLQKRISVDFNEVPLTDVVEFLRSVLDVNIILDSDSIYRREPEDILITLKLHNVKSRTLLRFLTKKADMKYSIIDGVIFISPDIVEPVYLRFYDVRDLIFTVPDFGSLAGGEGQGAVNASPGD